MIIKDFSRHDGDQQSLKDVARIGNRDYARNYENALRGIAGERQIVRQFNRAYAGSPNSAVIHDLTISAHGATAQIDHLLISRTMRKAWVFEAKNFEGTLKVDSDGRWTVDGRSATIPIESPYIQATGAANILRWWLTENGFDEIHEVLPVVVIPSVNSVDLTHAPKSMRIIDSDQIHKWFDDEINELGFFEFLYLVSRMRLKPFTADRFRTMCDAIASPASGNPNSQLRKTLVQYQDRPDTLYGRQDRTYDKLTPCQGVTLAWHKDRWRIRISQPQEVRDAIAKALGDVAWTDPDGRLCISEADLEQSKILIKGVIG